MIISYDGTSYHGWQVQNNAITVQQTLQDAMESVLQIRPDISGCSRTDSGVHAKNFCLHFEYDGVVPKENILKGLNTRLPDDISVLSIEDAEDDFHARYSVKSKEYKYYIWNSPVKNPFLDKYSWHYKSKLDESIMQKAAEKFIGKHDFVGFCSSGSSVVDTVRTIHKFTVERQGDMIIISVAADGFLYNMVRILAGTLYYVAIGKINPDDIPDIINSKDRNKAGITLCAKGLFLDNITY